MEWSVGLGWAGFGRQAMECRMRCSGWLFTMVYKRLIKENISLEAHAISILKSSSVHPISKDQCRYKDQ